MSLLDALTGDIENLNTPRALELRVANDLDSTWANVRSAVYANMSVNPELRAYFAPAYEDASAATDATQPADTAPTEPLPDTLRQELSTEEIGRHIDYLHAHQPDQGPQL